MQNLPPLDISSKPPLLRKADSEFKKIARAYFFPKILNSFLGSYLNLGNYHGLLKKCVFLGCGMIQVHFGWRHICASCYGVDSSHIRSLRSCQPPVFTLISGCMKRSAICRLSTSSSETCLYATSFHAEAWWGRDKGGLPSLEIILDTSLKRVTLV